VAARERLERLRGAVPRGHGRRVSFHRKMGLRIDYVLVGRRLAGKVLSCGIDRKGPKPSDHAPLLAELAP
jgi:exonuclease III